MADEQQAEPDLDEAPGWVILDPDGNIVEQGKLSRAQSVFLADPTEQEK